jgi:hypothetical protein
MVINGELYTEHLLHISHIKAGYGEKGEFPGVEVGFLNIFLTAVV